MSPNRTKHRDQYRRPADAITQNDAHWQAALTAHPWKKLNSGGYSVLQIDSRKNVTSRLQERSAAEDITAQSDLNNATT